MGTLCTLGRDGFFSKLCELFDVKKLVFAKGKCLAGLVSSHRRRDHEFLIQKVDKLSVYILQLVTPEVNLQGCVCHGLFWWGEAAHLEDLEPRGQECLACHLDVRLAETPQRVKVAESAIQVDRAVVAKGQSVEGLDLIRAKDVAVDVDKRAPALAPDHVVVTHAPLGGADDVDADLDTGGRGYGGDEGDEAGLVGDVEDEGLGSVGGQEEDGLGVLVAGGDGLGPGDRGAGGLAGVQGDEVPLQ